MAYEDEYKPCKECGEDTHISILTPLSGKCDDCGLADMDPEWVREHYPCVFEDDDELLEDED